MKKCSILIQLSFILIISILLFSVQSIAETECYKVSWVDDGDTIILIDGRHVRYIGINSPEIEHKDKKAEPYGYQAKKFNKSLVFSKKVCLEFDKERYDQYGRLLAYVFLKDGTFVNKAMIEHGLAYCLYLWPNVKYNILLLESQRRAMSAKKGIWSLWKENNGGYTGNRRSKRFHRKNCPFGKRTGKANRIFFSCKWEAFQAGFAPCKKCIGNHHLK